MPLIPLAPYASHDEASRGRLMAEPRSPTRHDFQRDRDRVIHSAAFRRLKHKTQVFVYHEGDHFRTRLTHSIEVAQVARSLARGLRLNEDLAEALALAHDLGHPPFGHTGETALDEVMAPYGGFDHNAQSLKIVTALESRYAAFDGLNLTWETLEGLVKHNGPIVTDAVADIPAYIMDYNAGHDLWLHTHASLEAQVAAIADDIAYDSHDIDDGLRAGLLTLESLEDIPIAADAVREVGKLWPDLAPEKFIHEVLRRLLTWLIGDVFDETAHRLANAAPQTADEVRYAGRAMVAFTVGRATAEKDLKRYMFDHVYRHPRIMAMREEASAVVKALFHCYLDDPKAWPTGQDNADESAPLEERAVRTCDFIAGMTDRYALQEYQRLFGKMPPLLRGPLSA
ncbi:MAG: deoxyguanosinetriphosphate triphosphohydrolase [Pseudomonadota bacterium]